MSKKHLFFRLLLLLITFLFLFALVSCAENNTTQWGEKDSMKIKIPKIKMNIPKIKVDGYSSLKHKSKFEQDLEIPALSDITSVEAFVNVGAISLSYSTDAKMYITAAYEMKAENQTDLNSMMSNINTTFSLSGSKIVIAIENKENNEDIWAWLDKNLSNYQLAVDLDIKVPRTIEQYELSSETGDVSIKGIAGTFSVFTETGSISVDEVVFERNSKFASETGDVSVSLSPEVGNETDIAISVETGDIVLSTNNHELKNETPATKGNNYFVTIAQKYHFTLETSTGDVKIK